MRYRLHTLSLFLLTTDLCLAAPGKTLMPPGGDASILVQRLSDGKVIYAQNPDKALTPASVTKVVTTAALLHYFSPAHTFQTKLYYDGTRQDGNINGSLYVKGDGDPFVISEKLWQLAADLKNMGIKSFSGNLVIDNSLFDDEKRDRSRADGDDESEHAYDAPVSAFGVNFNTLPIAAAPAYSLGEAGLVTVDPYPLTFPRIDNNTVTTAGSKSSVQAIRSGQGEDASLTVTGRIAQQGSLAKVYRAMGDPVLEGAETLKAFLLAAGITIKGKSTEGETPTSAKILYTLESYDLGFMVLGLNHHSNNYIADVLVKRLGAAFPARGEADRKGSGTLENGAEAMRRFLRNQVGIRDEFQLYNGSGLDGRNRFSAGQIVKILDYMNKHMELFPEYLASFPTAGRTGTLEKRFRGPRQSLLHGIVRAKTGTLSEPFAASTLAGYLGHPKYGTLAFAILNNGKKNDNKTSVAEFRKRQDQALLKLLEEF